MGTCLREREKGDNDGDLSRLSPRVRGGCATTTILTCDCDWDLLGDNGPDAVPGVALVLAGVSAADGLDLVEVLRAEVGQENSVLHPSVFWLGKTCVGKGKNSIQSVFFSRPFLSFLRQ